MWPKKKHTNAFMHTQPFCTRYHREEKEQSLHFHRAEKFIMARGGRGCVSLHSNNATNDGENDGQNDIDGDGKAKAYFIRFEGEVIHLFFACMLSFQ